MAEGDARAEARVAEVGVVRAQGRGRSPHLVYDARAREARDGHAGLPLDVARGLPQRAVPRATGAVREQRQLPERGRLGAPAGAESAGPGRVAPLGDHAHPMAREDGAHALAYRLLVTVVRDQEVRDREARMIRQLRRQTRARQEPRPQLARQIRQDPCAVGLAVDPSRAVGQAFEAIASASTWRAGRPSLRTIATSAQASCSAAMAAR